MTTTTPPSAAPAEAAPRRMDWYAPALAGRTSRPWIHVLLVLVLLSVGALLDAGLMQPAVMTVLRNSPSLAAVVAVVAAVMAAAAAGWAGWCWAGARGNHPDRYVTLVWPIVLMCGWAALGAAIYYLRLTAADTSTQALYAGVTANNAATSERTAAVVFLVVYVLVGLFAFADLRHLRNDAFTARLAALRDLASGRRVQQVAEQELRRIIDNIAIRMDTIADLSNQEQLALHSNQAYADWLKQASRIEQATGLGDETKTGITSTHHADNPANLATRAARGDDDR